jgi:CDGSH iron-sulfur domain-containing protein 3
LEVSNQALYIKYQKQIMETDERDKNIEFRVIANGPLHAKGKFTILDADRKTINIEEETWLCRCGGSKNKPFCDGSHKTNGFKY